MPFWAGTDKILGIDKRAMEKGVDTLTVVGKPTVCIYCLAAPSAGSPITEDHFFPEAWYPTSTPQGLEKWTVPACQQCNTKKSKLDDEIMHLLAFAIDADDWNYEDYRELVERHLRSFDPMAAHNLKDSYMRLSKMRSLKAKMIQPPIFNPESLMPMAPTIQPDSNPTLIKADTGRIEEFYRYLVRGLVFKLFDSQLIPLASPISIYLMHKQRVLEVLGDKLKGAIKHKFDRGPGLKGSYVYVKKESVFAAIFAVLIWQRHYFHAAVRCTPKSSLESG